MDWEAQKELNERLRDRDRWAFYGRSMAEQAWSMAATSYSLAWGALAYYLARQMGAEGWSFWIGLGAALYTGWHLDRDKPKRPD